MAAARAQAPNRATIARFQVKDGKGLIHLTRSSKYSVVIIRDEKFVRGMRVHLEFFLNASDGNLQPLGAMVTAVVQSDGKIAVVLAFGSKGSQETACASFCGILLPQQAAPAKGEHLSLELVCVVRKCDSQSDPAQVMDDHEHDWLGQVHLKLTSCWSHAVLAHSTNLFALNVREELPNFLPIALVYRLMQQRWATAAALFNRADQQQRSIDEDHNSFPALTKKHMNEMLRLVLSHSQWVHGEFPPLISRYTFCGGEESVDRVASLWGIFETLIELVGRSRFVRQMFGAGQLHFLTPDDAIELPVDSLSHLKGVDGQAPVLHLFRISRSLSSTPALVLEMIEIVDGTARKVQPSPYVTIEQIVAADGDVYQAFATLESAHHMKLRALNPAFRLRPDIDDDVELPVSLEGRQFRCEVVGANDLLNTALKEQQDMSAQLWWGLPAKPAAASFRTIGEVVERIKVPERTPGLQSSLDLLLQHCRSAPRRGDRVYDALIASY